VGNWSVRGVHGVERLPLTSGSAALRTFARTACSFAGSFSRKYFLCATRASEYDGDDLSLCMWVLSALDWRLEFAGVAGRWQKYPTGRFVCNR
jgi:hypothetical protein